MNKKGFTLIELLGTLVIISLLTVLIVPKILDWYNNSTDTYDELNEELIVEAARIYVEEHPNDFPEVDNGSYQVTITQMINYGSLDENSVKNVSKENYQNAKVKVVYNGDYFNYYLDK